MKKYPIEFSVKNLVFFALMLLLISGVLPCLYYLNILESIPNEHLCNYLIVNVALLSFFYFCIFINLPSPQNPKILSLIQQVSKSTFGIYLVHIFILRPFIWDFVTVLNIDSQFISIPITAIITFGISFLVIRTISILPLKKYIIG